jgi:hypothetical protein
MISSVPSYQKPQQKKSITMLLDILRKAVAFFSLFEFSTIEEKIG